MPNSCGRWKSYSSWIQWVLLAGVLLLLLLPSCSSAAVACPFCFNGKTAIGTCICECKGKYLAPTCHFEALDDVTLSFTLNFTAAKFSSELFQNAVERVTGGVQTYFVSATDVPQFKAMRVLLTMPGYTVGRVLTSISYRDAWTLQWGVMGAYPLTPEQAAQPSPLDFVLLQSGSVTISVMGVVWVGSALVLVLLVMCIESSWSTNTSEELGFSILRGRKRKVAPETSERYEARSESGDGSNSARKKKKKKTKEPNASDEGPDE
jgi:hypothetical protein